MPQHIVQQGESIISLSKQYGIPARKIWDHPDNRPLRERGRKVSILFPGDTVTIPDRENKQVEGATERRHRFRSLGRGSWLRLRFLRRGEPRAGESYRLIVDGREYRGTLDDEGKLEVRVPADARGGTIFLGDPQKPERLEVRVGHLDPLQESAGVQERLRNLGLFRGENDSASGPRMQAALRRFQARNGLELTGELDEATRTKLIEIHGS